MKAISMFAATLLAGVSFSALGQDSDVFVGTEEACPAGTARTVPSYTFEDGRLVQDGWLCESLHKGRG